MSSNKLGVSSPSGTQTVGFYKLIYKLWSFTAVYIYFLGSEKKAVSQMLGEDLKNFEKVGIKFIDLHKMMCTVYKEMCL